MSGFQYTEQERTQIAEFAPNLSVADWKELESLASSCPVLLRRARVARIEQTSAKLADLLETLSPRPDRSVWSREISQALTSLHKLRDWMSVPGPIRQGSNRARPHDLDAYLHRFVRFYASRIGYPGKAPTSPCARFVISAAGPPLGYTLTPGSVSNLIRSRVHTLFGLDLTTSSPELGSAPGMSRLFVEH
jgi:hypothetical protein